MVAVKTRQVRFPWLHHEASLHGEGLTETFHIAERKWDLAQVIAGGSRKSGLNESKDKAALK